MKIGITGYNGFIGGSVAKALSQQNHEVISLDVYTRFDQPDKFDSKDFLNLDWVLHFGASTSIQASFSDPYFTYHNNLNATLLALKIAHCSQAAFLFMSSYVYGIPQYLPIDENHPVSYVNPYMASKVASETICQQLSEIFNLPLVILRGFNIYGNQKIPGRLISHLLDAIQQGGSITLNDPDPKRDYLYIKDFYTLIFKIIRQNPLPTGIYNVGYGQSYSNLEVAEIARALSDKNISIIIQSHPRPNDILDCTANVNLIKKTFYWSPVYTLQQGLKELITMRTIK